MLQLKAISKNKMSLSFYKCLPEAHYLQISNCPCDHIENIFQNEICHV